MSIATKRLANRPEVIVGLKAQVLDLSAPISYNPELIIHS